MNRRARTAILALLLVLLAGGGAALWWWGIVPAVTVASPERGLAVRAVYATGVVEPVSWAQVAPLATGRLIELCRCEGETVMRGDVLGRLEDNEVRAELKQYEADAQFWRDEVARKKALLEKGLTSRQSYDQALSSYRQAEAQAAAVRERLEHYILRAPMDGVVLRRDGEVGEVVDARSIVFWVGRPRPLWITADVDEEDIALVSLDQRALIKADAFPGRALEGTVAEITPKGDPVNKTYRVRVALPDDTPLLIGMTVETNIVVEEKADALLIPLDAVTGAGVFVVEAGRARLVPVALGIRGNGRAEVLSGLGGGERLILDPPEGLEDGGRVRLAGLAPS